MRNIIFSQLLSILLLSFSIQSNTYSQTKSSVSANCGKCGKSVSPYAKVGDTCPHCGVRWGKENIATTNINQNSETNGVINPFAIDPGTAPSSRFDSKQSPIIPESTLSEPSTVIRSCKLRAASSSTSQVLLTIPKNADILIEKRKGEWVKVFYISNLKPIYGWIHSSNVVE